MNRSEIRSKIFASHQLVSKPIDFFGTQIELRQPTLQDVMAIQDSARNTEDGEVPKHQIVSVLLQYAYVPGTQEKVFEDADADSIMALPFGADMIRVTDALQELTQVNFTPKTGSSGQDQTTTS